MNWLFYLGGGWFYFWTIFYIMSKSEVRDGDRTIYVANVIFSLMLWGWICWKI